MECLQEECGLNCVYKRRIWRPDSWNRQSLYVQAFYFFLKKYFKFTLVTYLLVVSMRPKPSTGNSNRMFTKLTKHCSGTAPVTPR